jgi:hypothetical protein
MSPRISRMDWFKTAFGESRERPPIGISINGNSGAGLMFPTAGQSGPTLILHRGQLSAETGYTSGAALPSRSPSMTFFTLLQTLTRFASSYKYR